MASGPTPLIAQDVGVCDPFHPLNCLQPTSGGAMPITGSITATATVVPFIYTPTGYCRLSVTTAVLTSTCSGGIPALTNYLVVCGESADARWSDTTTPTTGALGVGMPFAQGSCMAYNASGSALRWVSQSGTAANLSFQFYQVH